MGVNNPAASQTPADRDQSLITLLRDNWVDICKLIAENKNAIEMRNSENRSYDGFPRAYAALALYAPKLHELFAREGIHDMVTLLDKEVKDIHPSQGLFEHFSESSAHKKELAVYAPKLHELIAREGVHDIVWLDDKEVKDIYPSPEHIYCQGPFKHFSESSAHKKVITGLGACGDYLYSAGKDGWFKIWSCNSGNIVQEFHIASEINTMITTEKWVFFGLLESVQCWEAGSASAINLKSLGGKVLSLLAGMDILFAGTKDGTLVSWKFRNSTFELANSIRGHSCAVVSLAGHSNLLISASKDSYVKIWHAYTFECVQTLQPHRSFVTSVICWESFVITCSLDKSLKLWSIIDNGQLHHVETITLEQGLLSLDAFNDPSGNPTLVCALADSTLQVYDIPSFAYRGWLRCKKEVRSMHMEGSSSFFFTGDSSGTINIWKWETSLAAEDWFS